MLSAIITVPEDIDELDKLFEFEEKEFQNGRASYSFEKKKDKLEIKITAEDSTALRSVLNTITKVMTVKEKTKKVLTNEG